jgi:NADP-dependent 3-hydroxy acid dehydrogenase YdfG
MELIQIVSFKQDDEYDRMMNANVKGVWLCLKYQIAQMLKQGSGAIVNTGSIYLLVTIDTSISHLIHTIEPVPSWLVS